MVYEKVLGVMLRCHARDCTLRILLEELLRLGKLPGVQVRIHALADRPTPKVWALLDEYRLRLAGVALATYPLVSREFGYLYSHSRRDQLAAFAPQVKPDWLMFQDDDNWFEPHHISRELPEILFNDKIDLWYARSVFFWDSPTTWNPDRTHCTVKIFRYLPGDEVPVDREIWATGRLHDQAILTGRTATMRTPLLDYGTYSGEERRRVYDVYAEAGKVDSFVTSGHVAPTRLLKFPEDAVSAGLMPDTTWKDLWGASHAS